MGAMAVPAAGAGRSDSGRGSSGYSRMVSAAAGLALGTAALYSTSGTQLMAHAEGKEGDDSDGKDPFEGTKLFPQPACIDKGMLKVSDVHTISYEVYGNPKGKPVLFVHGGPGGGTDPSMARYFDPKVILERKILTSELLFSVTLHPEPRTLTLAWPSFSFSLSLSLPQRHTR